VVATVKNTNSRTTVQCTGDWKLIKSGLRGTCPSLLFECKCGGRAKILALLTQGNWIVFSNADGVHNAVDIVPGELLKLSSHYKSILMDLVVEDASASPDAVLKDFMQSCRSDTYIFQLGINHRKFEIQVWNYVENLRRK
jgi:hypothetical protein